MEPVLCIQPATPNYETLPTYKITHYPLEPRDYMPYAQARICVTPTHLEVQMWAFEANPSPLSRLEGVFAGEGDKLLVFWVQADGGYGCFTRAGGEDRPLDVIAHTMDGEDLQGVYWGIQMALPLDTAARELGAARLAEGGALPGNFYKLSADPQKPHKGAMVPVDFAAAQEYNPAHLGVFRVVRY